MSVMHEVRNVREATTRSLVAVVGVIAGALPAAIHGTAALLYLFVGTIGL
jgi:hypothetical protein